MLTFLVLAINFILAGPLFAEETSYTLKPIVVIPTKSSLSSSQGLRNIAIISQERISQLPVSSVPELLQHVLGVDIRQRGAMGVQADVNMRGSNFEQVLILIDGVRMNDAQTGHHNLDLPITLEDIERIEILPGACSNIYGPGAFAGAINIVSKVPEGKKIAIESSGGSFALNGQALSVNYPLADFNNRLSFRRSNSSGWRPETFFNTTALNFSSQKDFKIGSVGYLFGYTTKDFGADSFYSNLYPHEEEHTDTRFFNLTAHLEKEIWQLKSDLYFRRHSDKYILDRTRPSWSVNYHTSYAYGADLELEAGFDFGSFLWGLEAFRDKITSTNLGRHSRDSQALYSQFQSYLGRAWLYNLGLRADHYQTWGWQYSPSVGLGYQINPQQKLKSSFGRSFRIPSFTELYYRSLANIGNANLTPEKAYSGEIGWQYQQGAFCAELTHFRRWGSDLIGWLRASSSDPWQAENIARVDTQGLELELGLRAQDQSALFSGVSAGYVYQLSESDDISLNTKYTLNFLKHHSFLGIDLALGRGIAENLILSYKQQEDQRPYFLLDSRLNKHWQKENYDLEIFLDITNLLNTSYCEQTDVVNPGRWVIAGMRIKL